MPLRFITGLLAVALLSLSACSDDADKSAPVITFLSPSANYSFRVPDTVRVEADIRDERMIESATVILVDENYIPRSQGATFFPGTTPFVLMADIPVTDKSLAGGRYYFLVTATDGPNTAKAYLEVSLQELPREVTGFIGVSGNSGGKTVITVLDKNYSPDTMITLTDGYVRGTAHALWEYFIYASREPSVLQALTLTAFEPAWEFAAELPRPMFTGLAADHELVFATANGDAGILNDNGNVILRTALPPQQTIACLAADEKYIYAEITDLSQSVREITVFYRVSGAVRYARRHDDAIIGILPENGKALLVSNQEGQGRVGLLDPEVLEISYSAKFSHKPFHFAMKTAGENFLLFTADRMLFYNLANDLLGTFLEGYYLGGSYDDLNGLLYLVTGSRVEARDESQGTIIHTIEFPEPAIDFHIVFNK